MVKHLIKDLKPEKLNHPREEEQIAVLSFKNLLNELKQKFLEAKDDS